MKPETVKFLIEQARAGKLGANVRGECRYRYRGKVCGIGALLPPDMPLRGDNRYCSVAALWDSRSDIAQHLSGAHGMSRDDADMVQRIHDCYVIGGSFDIDMFCDKLVDHFGQPT